MSAPVDHTSIEQADPARVGLPLPEHEQARAAVAALDRKDVAAAERHLERFAAESPIQRAWRLMLAGDLAVYRKELNAASIAYSQAFTRAYIQSAERNEQDRTDALRVAARALLGLGVVYRRQDRFEDARRTHRAAHDLIHRFGSVEETWQIHRELGLDAGFMEAYEEAAKEHERALASATGCADDAQRKQAVSQSDLARTRMAQSRFEAAVGLAREALTLWRDVDGSSAEVPLAEMVLGTALLRQGQSVVEAEPARACAGLEAAMDVLSRAGEALRAFGADYAADVALCEEQIDFARRLREGMAGDSGLAVED